MTVFKIREYAKAIAALLGAVATFLVTVNAPAQWSVWIGSIVAILTGVATFGVPNKVPAIPPADAAITAIQATVEHAQTAISEVDRLKDAAGTVLGGLPGIGPLAEALIRSVKLP